MRKLKFLFRYLGGLVCLLLAVNCTTMPPSRAPQRAAEAQDDPKTVMHPGEEGHWAPGAAAAKPAPEPRAGLATTYGETVDSEIDYQDFKRGFLAKPYAVGALYYNNREGASAMARHLGAAVPMDGGLITTAKGVVDWGLKSSGSGYLGGYFADDKVILEGRDNERYAIVLKNNTRQPLEFVISVDGLDVIDGEPAAYDKRGYIVGPKRIMEVKGFRRSATQVAAFRFGKVEDSYAALRHQDTRNVGVIGIAVFSQGGKNPWASPESSRARVEADPFPGQRFAIPPH